MPSGLHAVSLGREGGTSATMIENPVERAPLGTRANHGLVRCIVAAVLAVLCVAGASAIQPMGGATDPGLWAREPMVLIADDTLTLRVIEDPDINGDYTVRDDGTILLPMIGSVDVGGLTRSEAADAIVAALREIIREPHISLEVTAPAPRPIYVAGEVMAPQVLEWRQAPTLSKALALFGGMDENADLTNIKLRRDETEVTVDLTPLIREGDFTVDVALQPEDQVFVPLKPRCFISGPVANAGPAYFERGQTLYQLLSELGVVAASSADQGPDLRYVRVMRRNEEIVVNLDSIRRTGDPELDFPLAREDRIIVADRGEVFVAGRAQTQGPIISRSADTASRVLLAAGGPLEDAALDRCAIIRGGDVIPVDLAEVIVDRNPAADVPVVAGDLLVVPENQIIMAGAVMAPGPVGVRFRASVIDALQAAGGPTESADLRNVGIVRESGVITVDLWDFFEKGTPTDAPSIEPYDQIIVPEAWVYILGEIDQRDFGGDGNRGRVPYRQAETVRELIATVGQVSEDAYLGGASIVRGDQTIPVDLEPIIKTGDPEVDVSLEPGDRVVIPPLDENRVLVTGITSQAFTPEEAPTVARAMSLAGATALEGDLTRSYVMRGEEQIPVDLHALIYRGDQTQNLALEPGDILVVPVNEEGFVYVLGWSAGRQQPVRWFPGMRLSQALAEAGGIPAEASWGEIQILRGEGADREVFRVNFRDAFNPDEEEDPDAPRQGTTRREPGEKPGSVWIAEEGTEEDEYVDIRITDDMPVMEEHDPVLQRGDIILVPERRSSYARRSLLPWLSAVNFFVAQFRNIF